MKRLILSGLSVSLLSIALSATFASTAQAQPPSGDANPSDLSNHTVDTSQVIAPHAQKQSPPSGDADPSDLWNRTVDTSGIINPQAK